MPKDNQNSSNEWENIKAEEVTQYFTSPHLLQALLRQIEKDFGTAQVELMLEVEQQYSFPALCQRLSEALEKHLQKGGSLKNLINRVDLTPRQINQFVPAPMASHLAALATLIIKRELQKVVIRQWYKRFSTDE
ncbi:MAG: hypothetical protein ACK4GN_10485 [Runella sp.]